MQDGANGPEAEVAAAAEAYCRALHAADAGPLAQLFHEDANLYASQDGALTLLPRDAFLDRVGSREPGRGEASFRILSVDMAGPEMAHVKLEVAAGERRFVDYLNFLRLDGTWRVIAKLFRVVEGPAV